MQNKQHFAVLDGMRGVAALIVLLLHTAQTHRSGLPQAALAVDFFFILSGFVVAYAYEAKLRTTLTLAAFTRIRLLRLYPLIFLGVSIGVALTLVHLAALDDISPAQVAIAIILGFAILPCFVFPQWDTAYPMNLAAWSLFFELAVNFVYALTVRYLTMTRLLAVTALGAVVLVFISLHAGGLQPIGAGKYYFWFGFGRVLFPFAAGVLIYRLRRPVRSAPGLAALLPLALAALLLLPLGQSPAVDLLYVTILFPLLVGVGSAVSAGPAMTRLFLFAGEMSYPIYIIHQPLLRGFTHLEPHLGVNVYVACAAEVVACLVLAYLALRFFDQPVRAALNHVRLVSRPNGAKQSVAPGGLQAGT